MQTLRRSLTGQGCTLVPMTSHYTEHVIRWRNDPEIARWFLTRHVFESAGHEAWLVRTLLSNTDVNWVILDDADEAVGTVGLYDIDWSRGTGEFGRLVVGEPSVRGKGFARQATTLVLQAARDAGLREVYLFVKADNVAAYSLYRRLGFQPTNEGERDPVRMRLRFDQAAEA
jgi:diamine N-acetyltransferase